MEKNSVWNIYIIHSNGSKLACTVQISSKVNEPLTSLARACIVLINCCPNLACTRSLLANLYSALASAHISLINTSPALVSARISLVNMSPALESARFYPREQ